jgi:Flp pilus assembly pilin Flp
MPPSFPSLAARGLRTFCIVRLNRGRQVPGRSCVRKGETDMFRFLKDLAKDETGQDLVEYALLAAFLAIVSVAGLSALGSVIAGFYASLTPYFDL